MQWPTCPKGVSERSRSSGTTQAYRRSDLFRELGRLRQGRRIFDSNGPSNKLNHFIGSCNKWNVKESTLDLCPLVPCLPTESRRVRLECLMEDADNHQLSRATTCGLCKL